MDFARIINLIKKTGEKKCIVIGPDNKVYTVLPFNEYERLVLSNVSGNKGRNLTGSDLIGAILEETRFPGTIMTNVKK